MSKTHNDVSLVDRVSVPVEFFEGDWSFKVFIDVFGVCLISFTFAQYLLDLNEPVNIVMEENNVHLWPSIIIDFVQTYPVMIFAYSWKVKCLKFTQNYRLIQDINNIDTLVEP